MKRRSFVKSVAVGTAGIPFFGKAVVRNASARPNVLIIHTDQQAPWTLGAYGGTLVDTPNIDSIGRDGAVFNSFFCDSAVCTPSRGCFLSGLYAYNHGAFGNDEPLRPSVETFAHVLQRNGYDTGYIGKWHLDGPPALTGEMVGKDASGCPVWIPPDRAMGFSDSRYMFECWHGKKFVDRPGQKPEAFIYREIGDEKTYTTDWLAQKTIDFLRKERTNPFCCMVSIPDPHTPFWTRTPYSTQYKPEDMPLPETLEVPEFMPMAQTKEIQATFMTTQAARYQKPVEQLLREWKGQYCGMAKCIDDSVGRILDCLKEQGQLDNTVIVYTSDHGEHMGEQGIYSKARPFNASYHIPFLIRWPEKIRPGTVLNAPSSTIDFKPTILSLLGMQAQQPSAGRDLSPWFVSDPGEEGLVYIQTVNLHAGLITDRYMLTFNFDWTQKKVADQHGVLLFDRKKEPFQKVNLAEDPSYFPLIRKYHAMLLDKHRQIGSRHVPWLETWPG